MRVTDGVKEYEAIEISQTMYLCRGGQVTPHLIGYIDIWGNAKALPERRHAQRRAFRLIGSGRRRIDHTELVHDLEAAVLRKKLAERTEHLAQWRRASPWPGEIGA